MPPSQRSPGKIYIVLLNWNNWRDTVECLESVFNLDYPNVQVVVCDNDSQDQSLERIKDWANGTLRIQRGNSPGASTEADRDTLVSTSPIDIAPVPKPVPYVEYHRTDCEQAVMPPEGSERLVLIQTGANLGFAGGNNVGIRYAMRRGDFEYLWLLNNDTVVPPDALTQLVRRMEEKPDAGICGSTLLYFHSPERVQTLGGGTYQKWLGVSRHIMGLAPIKELDIDARNIEQQMDYVTGASMLVRKRFLNDVGLMNEDYFLYYEELDWAVRAKRKYSLAYAPKSVVYHKEGGTIGVNQKQQVKSRTADYYIIKNRLVFTRRFFPACLPVVYLGLLVTLFNRARRGQWSRLPMILRLCVQPC